MATVNFNCNLCGKLMAVLEDHLGKRVRCPHCQQVIQAPSTRPTTAAPETCGSPELFVTPLQAPLDDNIFEELREAPGDDLFGGAPQPLVVTPPVPPPGKPTLDPTAIPPSPTPAPVEDPAVTEAPTLSDLPVPPMESPNYEATVTYLAPEPGALPGAQPIPPSAPAGPVTGVPFPFDGKGGFVSDLPLVQTAGVTFPVEGQGGFVSGLPSAQDSGREALAGMPTPGPTFKPKRPSLFIPTLLIFLIPYSIGATFFAAYFYYRWVNKFDPLELLPDPRPGKKQGGARRLDALNDYRMPDRLLGRLGDNKPIRIGDLEVIPQAVAWAPDSRLALTVKLRNRSEDVDFNPVDTEFNKYDRVGIAPKPLTFLRIGTDHVYGGEWSCFRNERRFDGRLEPGEEMIARLVTDRRDANTIKQLDELSGPLVWRIQVRRGLVRGNDGKEYSATGVVGVVFKAKDVQPMEAADGSD
jgi:hypothetical protein